MKTAAIEIEDKVDQLLTVLDRDIEHIRDTLLRLNELCSLVVRRDEASLHKLLESIQSNSNSYKENEQKRRLLREELAMASDCSFEQMTLSRLEAGLSGERKAKVTQRKTELQTLAGELQKEHLSTTMLLSECARFNSMLLRSMLHVGRAGTITYNPNGSAERQSSSAFVNLQF